jgi:hypothetical protein
MLRVFGKNSVIKFRHKPVCGPIPEMKDRRNQSDPRHVARQPILGQQIESGGMGRCCAGVGLQSVIVIEQPDGNTPSAQDPRTQQTNRAAACDQNPALRQQC